MRYKKIYILELKQKYRLTAAGAQAVLENSETLTLLRSLSATLQQQVEHFRSMRDHLGMFVDQLQPLTNTITRLAQRIEPPDVEQICRRLSNVANQPTASDGPKHQPVDAGWLDEVVRLVAEQRQRDRYQPLTLPQLYAAIRKRWPALTLGQFHDGLRTLRDQGRIRLSPYTRALATIDDPRNALFLDGEVMYHAELP